MSTQQNPHGDRVKAVLVLEDGRTFTGTGFGATTNAFGEVNFSTAMTGYQETLTDPATAGTLVALTFPHIGNTGMNLEDAQSDKIHAAGLIVRELSRRPSNWRSTSTLQDDLAAANVPGIQGIDTRALTHHIRDHGVQTAGLFVGADADKPVNELVQAVKEATVDKAVGTAEAYTVNPADHGYTGTPKAKVAVVDFGVKNADLASLASRGVELLVLPATTTVDAITAAGVQGVFLSDGPADPTQLGDAVDMVKELLDTDIAIFGVSLGQILLGQAAGATVNKLVVGHHGANQPVQVKETSQVLITAQSQQYALDVAAAPNLEITHVSLNDGVVEGIKVTGKNAFAVGFHPEGSAGPLDAASLFDQFVDSL